MYSKLATIHYSTDYTLGSAALPLVQRTIHYTLYTLELSESFATVVGSATGIARTGTARVRTIRRIRVRPRSLNHDGRSVRIVRDGMRISNFSSSLIAD